MNLKFQLRVYLENRKMTASQLARLADVPKQSISDWLGGSIPRDLQKLKRVADALQTTVDHLAFGTGTTLLPEGGLKKGSDPIRS